MQNPQETHASSSHPNSSTQRDHDQAMNTNGPLSIVPKVSANLNITLSQWFSLDDGVMGGLSKSSPTHPTRTIGSATRQVRPEVETKDSHVTLDDGQTLNHGLLFQGVSHTQGGGFASIRF